METEKISKLNTKFYEKFNKINKHLARLTAKKRQDGHELIL
jgi:hypothetical protein